MTILLFVCRCRSRCRSRSRSRSLALVLLSLLRVRIVVGDASIYTSANANSDERKHEHGEHNDDATTFDKGKNEKELLEWIRSKGGDWNSKQELRYDEKIPDLYGVFASDNIERGEILASIPWECVIYPEQNKDEHGHGHHNIQKKVHPDRFDNNCSLVQRVAEEIGKHSEEKTKTTSSSSSKYSHYVEGLIQTAKEHSHLLPAHWSKGGRELLSQILFQQDTSDQVLPPEDPFLIYDDWKHHCDALVDPVSTLLVMTHGEDFGMVPLTDKFNSRGGNWTGAYFAIENGDGEMALEIRAKRFISRGEQIFTDYHDYGQIGTPELLRDYGFVETYPQRWIFHHQHVAFDVVEQSQTQQNQNQKPTATAAATTNENGVSGEDGVIIDDVDDDDWTKNFEIQWHERIFNTQYMGKPSTPTTLAVENLRHQLDRLEQRVYPMLSSSSSSSSSGSLSDVGPSEHELQVVRRFYNGLTTALKLAIRDVVTKEETSTEQGEEGNEL